MTTVLSAAEFWQLFEEFEHTAFRLEVRDRYADDEEAEPLRRFLAGESADDAWFMDFYRAVEEWTAAGKVIQRVRVVTEPHSDYTRFGLDLARLNVAAGEDIRYLPRPMARELGLPEHDYWLFDSRQLVILRFDGSDRLLGAEPVAEPADIIRHGYWRDAALHHAQRHHAYRQGLK